MRVLGLVLLVATGARAQAPRPSTPSGSPPASVAPPEGDDQGGGGRRPGGRIAGGLESALPLPFRAGGDDARNASPGSPRGGARPRPGGLFDPGAAGPGISQGGDQNFLDGALDRKTGWPFVFLDHFRPRPERLEGFWYVTTRDCPQELGSDPWSCLKVMHFDAHGDLEQRDPAELFAQAAHRPVLIQVQGSLTTPEMAVGGLFWTHSWLQAHRCLTPDAVVVAFDWPSQRIYRNGYLDVNEKGRRAFVAAFHLARFVQAFPAGARVCLLGQSYGGRVVPGALHLLGGGSLATKHGPEVCLGGPDRPDFQLHGVIIAGASDHNWLDPGQKYDRALHASRKFLNLYNRKDESLLGYPSLVSGGHRRALGRIGLTNRDLNRLGPLAARYEEHDVNDILGPEHSLLDATANPRIGRWIAPYVWAPDPGPLPAQGESKENPYSDGGSRRQRNSEADAD